MELFNIYSGVGEIAKYQFTCPYHNWEEAFKEARYIAEIDSIEILGEIIEKKLDYYVVPTNSDRRTKDFIFGWIDDSIGEVSSQG